MKKILTLLCLAFVVHSANAFWPFAKTKHETTSSDARLADSNALTVDHAVNGEKASSPSLTVNGSSNSVSLDIVPSPQFSSRTSLGLASKANQQFDSFDDSFVKTKLPFSIALIGVAIGIAGIVAAIQYARKTSPAVDAAITFADSKLKGIIEAHEMTARSETDAAKLAVINSNLASLNDIRGKINSYTP